MASSSAVPISRAELNKTSIVLGYQNLNYETTANIMNTSSVGGTLTREEIQKFKQLKANLRATHFELGDAPMTYETSNKLADPTGNMSEYTAKLDIGAKRLLRQTSATLGYEHPTYETCTASATRWDKTKMLESIHQREASKKNNDPRKVNYDFGDEKTNYVSTSKDEFVYDAAKVQPAVLADAVKKDLRQCHYTLGNASLNYFTSNHMPDVPPDVLKAAKGTISDETNPWRVNINLTHE